jgi:hypothetical protein
MAPPSHFGSGEFRGPSFRRHRARGNHGPDNDRAPRGRSDAVVGS